MLFIILNFLIIFFVPKQLKTNIVTADIVIKVYSTNFILYKKLTLLASLILFIRSPIIKLKLCTLFILEYILYPNAIILNIRDNLLLSNIANIVVITFKYNSHEKYYIHDIINIYLYLLYLCFLKPSLKNYLFSGIHLFL